MIKRAVFIFFSVACWQVSLAGSRGLCTSRPDNFKQYVNVLKQNLYQRRDSFVVASFSRKASVSPLMQFLRKYKRYSRDLFHIAASNNCYEVMFWLVHNSLVHVDVLDCEGSTALYNALVDANYGAMEALCLLGANLEWVGEDQYTYLQTAVADEDVKAVEILTDYEADIYSLGEVMLRQIKFSFSYCGLRKFAQKTASKILNPDFNIDNVEVINLHDDKLLALLVKSYGNQKKAKKKHLFKHRTKAMVKEFMSDEKLRTEKIAAIRAS